MRITPVYDRPSIDTSAWDASTMRSIHDEEPAIALFPFFFLVKTVRPNCSASAEYIQPTEYSLHHCWLSDWLTGQGLAIWMFGWLANLQAGWCIPGWLQLDTGMLAGFKAGWVGG